MANKKPRMRLLGKRRAVEMISYEDRSEQMRRNPDQYFEEARKRAMTQLKAERRGDLARAV